MKNDTSVTRVIQRLRREVAAAGPGDRLPSVRELMARHRLSPVTVQRAVAALVAEGLVEARPGQGTFVTAPSAPGPSLDQAWQSIALGPARASTQALADLIALPAPGSLSLSSGYLPADLQPTAPLAAAMRRALVRPGVWDRTDVEGLEPLRAWFAHSAGGGLRARDVLILPGSQPAITTAFRALSSPGAAIVMESPTFVGALAAASAAGLRVVPVPTDRDGVRPELLAEALSLSGARLFYCQPTFANPSGAVLSAERRRATLEVVRAAGAFLVEDDWARDLWLEAEPPPPLAAADPDGHVVYIRSLTKSAAPGLRVGALAARGAALARLKAARTVEDFFVAGPLQEAALQLVTSPSWRRHLKTLRLALRRRRDGLAATVRDLLGDEALPTLPRGGLHLWVRLPEEVSEEAVVAGAARERLVVSPGRRWFPAESSGPHLRLTFAGAPPEVLGRGVELLRRILAR
jgi:DNA-binding transcriptional MocR family regulator